jgi:hypothetical protein
MRFVGVVDGCLGAQCLPFLVVLLDRGVLVVHVQARRDVLGDDPGAEYPGGRALAAPLDLPGEDEADPVRAAQVQVVADDLLEEDPPAHRGVEHLGEGELRLQDGQLIAVSGGAVGRGERVRQPGQPLAQQRVDLVVGQPVADRLHRRPVAGPGEAVVQGGEADPGLGGLPLGVFVAVDAQPGGVVGVGPGRGSGIAPGPFLINNPRVP